MGVGTIVQITAVSHHQHKLNYLKIKSSLISHTEHFALLFRLLLLPFQTLKIKSKVYFELELAIHLLSIGERRTSQSPPLGRCCSVRDGTVADFIKEGSYSDGLPEVHSGFSQTDGRYFFQDILTLEFAGEEYSVSQSSMPDSTTIAERLADRCNICPSLLSYNQSKTGAAFVRKYSCEVCLRVFNRQCDLESVSRSQTNTSYYLYSNSQHNRYPLRKFMCTLIGCHFQDRGFAIKTAHDYCWTQTLCYQISCSYTPMFRGLLNALNANLTFCIASYFALPLDNPRGCSASCGPTSCSHNSPCYDSKRQLPIGLGRGPLVVTASGSDSLGSQQREGIVILIRSDDRSDPWVATGA